MYDDLNSCNSDTECLPLSHCDLNSLNSDDSPPTYCKPESDSRQTEQDHFCCTKREHVQLQPDPQSPIFTKFYNFLNFTNVNDESWPCADHTEMCQTLAKTNQDSCNPGNEHYEFMKLACMESCQICKEHVSSSTNILRLC